MSRTLVLQLIHRPNSQLWLCRRPNLHSLWSFKLFF
nr:MAG TPA: hypothetical protein [Caudoviricetes sp.]